MELETLQKIIYEDNLGLLNITNNPRIYVASLADYNAGILHGIWIDATLEAEKIQEKVNAMLKASTQKDAEEWAIHDYEGFEDLDISEYDSFEYISSVAKVLNETLYPREMIAEYLKQFDRYKDPEETISLFDEKYLGCFESLGEWAERWFDDIGDLESVPKHLRGYIDFDGYGRDAEMNGDIMTIELGRYVHVFWNH